jgi:hypothetical protein
VCEDRGLQGEVGALVVRVAGLASAPSSPGRSRN